MESLREDRTTRRQRERKQAERERSLLRIVAAVALVIVVLIVLYLWDRGSFGGGGASSSGGGTVISDVPGLDPSEDYVAVILKQGADIDKVLKRHRLPNAISTGANSYVIDVGNRQTDEVIGELQGDEAVTDAGRVFNDTRSSSTTSPTP